MHPQHQREAEHGGERHGQQPERAERPAAQRLIDAAGGLVGEDGGSPQPERLDGHEGHGDAEQRAPEHAGPGGGAGQIERLKSLAYGAHDSARLSAMVLVRTEAPMRSAPWADPVAAGWTPSSSLTARAANAAARTNVISFCIRWMAS